MGSGDAEGNKEQGVDLMDLRQQFERRDYDRFGGLLRMVCHCFVVSFIKITARISSIVFQDLMTSPHVKNSLRKGGRKTDKHEMSVNLKESGETARAV